MQLDKELSLDNEILKSMKPLIQSKQARPTVAGPAFCILLALGFPLLCPVAQAVVPSPDGGYPNFNTAEGQNALFNLTSGSSNTAVGWFSLFSNTDGSFNTAVGAGTLLFNVGNQSTGDGTRNTAIGTAALYKTSKVVRTQPSACRGSLTTPKAS
jgi:hypothetical protein